jgi:hypothetical protein
VSGDGLEDAQGSQRQTVEGGWHFKFSLIGCQRLRLLRVEAWRNLSVAGDKSNSEYVMNQINLVERLAQGLLAVTIVFAIGLAFELALLYEGGGIYAV